MEDNVVKKFDQMVKEMTNNEVYDAYIATVMDSYHGRLSNRQFKTNLHNLLADYPELNQLMPVFFSEIDEPEASANPGPLPSKTLEMANYAAPCKLTTKPKGPKTAKAEEL